MMGNIFNKHYLSDFINNYRIDLIDQIEKLENPDASNIKEIINNHKSNYKIEPLELKDPIPSKPIESTRDSINFYNEPYKQKVFEIKVEIPFDGNYELFYCCPSSTSLIIYIDKSVRVSVSNINANIILEKLDADKYQNQVNKIISDLSSNIPAINAEVEDWNNQLENLIIHLIEKRRGIISEKLDFMEKIGLNVNPKSNDYMIPPPIAKKTIPIPVSETKNNAKMEVLPILQEEVYKDIKEVLYNVGKAIERKPALYIDKYEEDIRDIFLLFLETRYESTSGVGEAFNKKGKTDILLKYAIDGTNLFVAECKYWKGQKKLLEAIDQLLGYLTHRDSKTALMIFVDQKDLTSIIETIKNEIPSHHQFKRFVKDNYETSMSYEFTLPSDNRKIIQIEVMLFHFPKKNL